MAYFLDDIADYLEDNGLGTVGTNIFVGKMPQDSNCIALLQTNGSPPPVDLPEKTPSFQVLIRDPAISTGVVRLMAVRNLLHIIIESTIGTTSFMNIFAMSDGGHIGEEPETGSQLFSINFNVKHR